MNPQHNAHDAELINRGVAAKYDRRDLYFNVNKRFGKSVPGIGRIPDPAGAKSVHFRRGDRQLVCPQCKYVNAAGARCRNVSACRMPWYPCIGKYQFCRKHARMSGVWQGTGKGCYAPSIRRGGGGGHAPGPAPAPGGHGGPALGPGLGLGPEPEEKDEMDEKHGHGNARRGGRGEGKRGERKEAKTAAEQAKDLLDNFKRRAISREQLDERLGELASDGSLTQAQVQRYTVLANQYARQYLNLRRVQPRGGLRAMTHALPRSASRHRSRSRRRYHRSSSRRRRRSSHRRR